MTTVANTLTNSIVKLKMLEYKNDLSKFENGVSRKFKFSDTSIVTGREIKFFPINMIEAMKKLSKFIIFSAILLLNVSCAAKKSAAELSEQRRILVEKIENQQFKFIANYAIPRGNFQPRYLTSTYDVVVTRDTVYSHLPYFGVA